MAEIISLDSARTSKPVRECLREVIAKQREWAARQKELEQLVWFIENGIPVTLGGQGDPIEPSIARQRVANDLYQAIATQQILKMYRSHLRQCVRAASSGNVKKVESIMERAHAIADGPEAWNAYMARKYAKAAE